MKTKIAYLLPLIGIIALFSCQKNESAQVARSAENGPDAADVLPANHGFATAVNAGFYVFRDDDAGDETTILKWQASLDLGERFAAGETRRLTFQGTVYNFIEATRPNGDSGFALVSQSAVGGVLAVVVDEAAHLFSSAQNIGVTGNVLTRGSVIVSYPEDETGGFVRIRGRDFGRDVTVNDQFVRHLTLSTRESDLESATLLLTANSLPASREAQKRAMLEVALAGYPDSAFFTEIYALLYPQQEETADAYDYEEYGFDDSGLYDDDEADSE